jgi:hypothetical protein
MMVIGLIYHRVGRKFVSCQVGLELLQYEENLAEILNDFRIYGLRKHSGPDYDPGAKDNFIPPVKIGRNASANQANQESWLLPTRATGVSTVY